eukprot:695239-Prymnesium_polylepis.1
MREDPAGATSRVLVCDLRVKKKTKPAGNLCWQPGNPGLNELHGPAERPPRRDVWQPIWPPGHVAALTHSGVVFVLASSGPRCLDSCLRR